MTQRRSVAASRFVPKTAQPVAETETPEAKSNADLAEALYRAEAERELDEEEELFNVEESIARPTSYNWEDKYRPRKPRYFNRVHTGYEWNKYNQTHYESVIAHSTHCIECGRLIHHTARTTLPQRLCKATSSTSSTLISSTSRRLQRTRLSRSQGTTTQYCCISWPVHHTKI